MSSWSPTLPSASCFSPSSSLFLPSYRLLTTNLRGQTVKKHLSIAVPLDIAHFRIRSLETNVTPAGDVNEAATKGENLELQQVFEVPRCFVLISNFHVLGSFQVLPCQECFCVQLYFFFPLHLEFQTHDEVGSEEHSKTR